MGGDESGESIGYLLNKERDSGMKDVMCRTYILEIVSTEAGLRMGSVMGSC
jgi:hypothetical protein